VTTAFWKALYTVGHDAAFLAKADDGWVLGGTAVYLKESLPTALNYRLDLAANWEPRAGSIAGRVGDAQVNHDIQRDGDQWILNGVLQRELKGVVDLDFRFTPATNFAQLRRMNLGIGEKTRITVAWMDVESASLKPLPQVYERLTTDSYDYNSPDGPYRATLELQESGFVRVYPELWQAELS